MSLAVLANHMATKGRHGDDMLVHMSSDEVENLQKLAQAHGLTLTINPETGLPEAFSLKSLLKAIAPIALGAFLGPAGFGLTGFQSALAVGGIGALATGSLEKGLMMGLGAYGGAGLGEGLKAAALENVAAPSSTAIVSPEAAAANAGASTGAGTAPTFAYQAPQMTPRPTPFDLGTGMFEANAPTAAPEMFSQAAPVKPALVTPQPTTSLDFAGVNAKEAAWKSASLADKASMAYEAVSKAPLEFAKANMGPGLAALYSGVALGQEESKLPQAQRRQGYIRNYGFDPYSGIFTAGEITPVSAYAANGGLIGVGYNHGGIVALADGGTPKPTEAQEDLITNIYQTTLGRDPDPEGLEYWSSRLAAGESPTDVYSALQGSAKYVLGEQAATLAPNIDQSYEEAITPYTGYSSTDATSIGDEWIQNVLGRAPTAADTQQDWYQELSQLGEKADVEAAYKDFVDTYGVKKQAPKSWFEASQLKTPKIRAMTKGPTPTTGDLPGYTYDPTAMVGSGLVRPEERMGMTTDWTPGATSKGEPLIPTMQDVVNTYTGGGGLTGRLPYVPKSLAEQEQLYNRLTGSSKSAYDYLQGRSSQYPMRANVEGPLALPYGQAALNMPASAFNTQYIYDPVTKQYIINPNYKPTPLPTPEKEPTGPVETVLAEADKMEEAAPGMADGGIAELAGYSAREMASVGRPVDGYASAYGVRPKPRIGYTPSVFDRGEGSPTSAATGPADPGAIDAAISLALGNIGNLGVTALGAIANAFSSPNPNAESVSVTDVNPAPVAPTDTTDVMSPDSAAAAASAAATDSGTAADGTDAGAGGSGVFARGGMIPHYAGGGIYNLGSYSDGGRLLKGPGDGVSDSIPATIGNKQPARLADGEFVIPARIVSELGNGSTDAGARKLYAMMDRIQARRGKTTGKGKVAVNSRADKLLPA